MHPNRYVFGAKYRDGHTRQVKRKNLTRDEQLFVSSIIPGIKDAVSAAAEAFGIDDRKKARKKAIFLLKQERVTKALAKAAKDVAKELGLDHKYVIKGFMKLHEFGEDERVALGALKELAKVIGTTGQQMRFAESGFAMFQEVDPEQIEEFADDRALAEKEIQQLEGKEEESE